MFLAFYFLNFRYREPDFFNLRFSLATYSNQVFLTGFSQRGFAKYLPNYLTFFCLQTVIKIVLEVRQGVQPHAILRYIKILTTFQVCSSDFSNTKIAFLLTNTPDIKHTQLYPVFKTQNSKRLRQSRASF